MIHDNRRQEQRFSISQLIELSFGKERWVHARGIDISRNGFRGKLSEEIDTGSSMYVLFRIDDTAVQVEAVAVHISPDEDGMYDAGFQFSSVDTTARAAIDTFIQSVARQE
jgi:c-di-GMP-binding flagellar brake protein YcgR